MRCRLNNATPKCNRMVVGLSRQVQGKHVAPPTRAAPSARPLHRVGPPTRIALQIHDYNAEEIYLVGWEVEMNLGLSSNSPLLPLSSTPR
ncbi:jg11528 [Pararge aegeria aegeria]|uniref:Jg11528 protein n=1 Tax=Pararge aegeria aegeria TaxID=348720 RepID=A0A8S4RPG4_9NEOP|nr:jg11528 [Pararge aegeria aegeria]